MTTVTIGVDLAKQMFSTCAVDASGRVQKRKDFQRDDFAAWLAQVPAGTVVAMEACSGAHHWARRSFEHDLQPRLMAAQFVTPFRKRRTTKNDRNDAEAIATAARQGNMRFVPVKTVDQQARLAWHRAREGYKTESLAVSNRLRGLLADFAVVATVGSARDFKNGGQLAAWLGLAPTQHSSGGHTRLGNISGRGAKTTIPTRGASIRWCNAQRTNQRSLRTERKQIPFNAGASTVDNGSDRPRFYPGPGLAT